MLPKYVSYPVFSDTSSVNDVYRSMNATASQAHTAPHTRISPYVIVSSSFRGPSTPRSRWKNGDVDGGATFLYTSAEAHPPGRSALSLCVRRNTAQPTTNAMKIQLDHHPISHDEDAA